MCSPCCAGGRLNAQAAVLNAVEMRKNCARERPAIVTAQFRMWKLQVEQQAPVWGKQSAASGCGAQSPVKFMLARVPCKLSSSAWAISGLQQHRAQQSGCTSASNLYACRGVV